MNIVSDSWLNMPRLQEEEPTLTDVKLGELLDKVSTAFNYNLDKPDSILEFRHRKWAKMRLNQIPDEWVTAWFKEIDLDSGETDRSWKTELPQYTPPTPATEAGSNQ